MTMTALSRTTDPITSHEAAARVDVQTQCERVLGALKRYPGSTSKELADKGDLNRYMVARRLPDLLQQGLARKGTPRSCNIGMGRAVPWWPVYEDKQRVLF